MGLFFKKEALASSDSELIMLAMLLSIASDGDVDEKETDALIGLAGQMAEFADKDLKTLYSKSMAVITNGGYEAAITKIASATDKIKNKAFIAACELAFSSGGVGEDEQSLLEKMANDLTLDESLGQAVLMFCEAKYQE